MTTQIFLGNGETSEQEIFEIELALERALDLISGLQQPQRWDHEPTPKELLEYAEMNREMRRVLDEKAAWIYTRLTGKEIKVVELV